MILTDAKVRNAKPQEKDYRLTDGHGLHLYVKANGTKLWHWRYEFNGKEKLMFFGAYPEVTIAASRTAHDRARKGDLDRRRATKRLAGDAINRRLRKAFAKLPHCPVDTYWVVEKSTTCRRAAGRRTRILPWSSCFHPGGSDSDCCEANSGRNCPSTMRFLILACSPETIR